jgi:hypothetical protein
MLAKCYTHACKMLQKKLDMQQICTRNVLFISLHYAALLKFHVQLDLILIITTRITYKQG